MSAMSAENHCTFYTRYFLRDSWLIALSDGWRFPTHVVEPITNYRGDFAVLMWRAVG